MQKSEDAVTPMSNVDYLIGNSNISNTPLRAFDDEVVLFLNAFSAALMKSPAVRLYPDLSSLAFWCRKANIKKLKALCPEYESRLGKGLCFHISPSNIPVNFAFSYFFSLLAGNANIVRVPSKRFAQIDIICDLLNHLLTEYPAVAERTAVVRYPADNTVTQLFSGDADIRMIWGGDHTIANMKSLTTKPRATDIYFSDRYSVCVIDADKVNQADEMTMQRLAAGFYNDTYLMDQNACSSPQLVLWLNDTESGRNKFWTYVAQAAEKYVLQEAVAVDKYTQLCEEAILLPYVKEVVRNANLIYRIELSDVNVSVVNNRGKGGYFYEYAMADYDDLLNIVTEQYQTLTYFGVDAAALKHQIITQHIRGIDRIVPVGKALDIGAVWDGYDLIRQLSRIISVE